MKLSRVSLYTNFDRPLSLEERQKFKEILIRRGKGEPVAYILRKKEFFGLEFEVNEHVLIPRPDTEVLIEAVLEYEKAGNEIKSCIDLGTGSGCIAITLVKELKNLNYCEAWDISPASLEIANRNAIFHDVGDRVVFHLNDILHEDSWKDNAEKVDVIVSNPPYIAHSEKEVLSNSVKNFEPSIALFAEEDGLIFYKTIAQNGHKLLKTQGKLFLEIGYQQAECVVAILKSFNWHDVKVLKDYHKCDRVVVATL